MSFSKVMRTMFVVLCLSALLVSVAGAEGTIKIGLLAPLTGKSADDGINVKNSVEMAVEKVNAAGGVLGKKIELVTYDDRAEPKEQKPPITAPARRRCRGRFAEVERQDEVLRRRHGFHPTRLVGQQARHCELPAQAGIVPDSARPGLRRFRPTPG